MTITILMSNNDPQTSSPQPGPRDEDVGSTYALQVALRNLKERYQKLQRKVAFIEEENKRLVQGKTELFSEIGVMQESSIKLREKNLHLNQEIHNKHQENCTLRDKFASLTERNLALSQDNKRLQAQVTSLQKGHTELKLQVTNLSCMSKTESNSDGVLYMDASSRLTPDSITPGLTTSTSESDNADDSLDTSQRPDASQRKPRPTTLLTAQTRADESHDCYVDNDESSDSSLSCSPVTEELLLAAEAASDRMDALMDAVQRQNERMRDLLVLSGTNANAHSWEPSTRLVDVLDRDTLRYTQDNFNDIGTTATTWLPGAGITPPSHHPLIQSGHLIDDDTKICPMCNQTFDKDFDQEAFESHVMAHFEDIDVGLELV